MTFDIDSNGILSVSAKDMASGKSQSISITGSTRLSEDTKKRMVEDAERYADADKKRREDAEKLNAADAGCYEAEKMLANFADKLTDDLKKRIETALRETKEALLKKDATLATERAEALKKVLQEAGAVLYSQSGQASKGSPYAETRWEGPEPPPMWVRRRTNRARADRARAARWWMPSTGKTNNPFRKKMTTPLPLQPQQLHHPCDPGQFGFQTTADLEDLTEIIGQMRAMDAVRFGAGIRHEGYNLFVLGPSGMGKRSMVRQFLEKKAADEHEPADWCYLNNFAQPHKPQALKLPSGRGAELRQHMEQLVDYLRSAIPALFESDEYRAKAAAIQEEFSKRQEQVFKELGEEAEKQEIVLLRTPDGFAFAPTRNHEVIPPDEYEKLPEEEKKRVEAAIAELQERLEKILRHMPQWRRERHERVKQLNRETTLSAVEHLVNELRASLCRPARGAEIPRHRAAGHGRQCG